MRTFTFSILFVISILVFGAALGGVEELSPILDVVEGIWNLAFDLYGVLGT